MSSRDSCNQCSSSRQLRAQSAPTQPLQGGCMIGRQLGFAAVLDEVDFLSHPPTPGNTVDARSRLSVSLKGKHSCPRDCLTRAPSLRRAGLEGQSYCPRHVQVSASSLRRACLEGKHSYPRDGLIMVTSLRRAGLEGQSCAATRRHWDALQLPSR